MAPRWVVSSGKPPMDQLLVNLKLMGWIRNDVEAR